MSEEFTKEEVKILKKICENPMFKNMMQGMSEGASNNYDPAKPRENDTPRPQEKELTREEKQRRLREKIKEKRGNR